MSTEPTAATRASLWERDHVVYLAIAYTWSWVLWIGAWLLAWKAELGDLLFNEEFVWQVLFDGDVNTDLVLASLLALLAVYGPALGGVIMSRHDPAIPPGDLWERVRKVRVPARMYGAVLGILALVTLPPLIVSALVVEPSTDAPSLGQLLPFLLVFFIVQMLTSGTEEIGWRGYLTEKLMPGRGFWDTGWAVGPVWALWHLPVVLMLFAQQGMVPVQIIGSLAGFGIGIVAMAILHSWFYERTGSVFLNIVIHAAFNTVPLTIVLLFEGSPAAVASQLLLWGVVIVLKSRADRADQQTDQPS